MQKRLIKKAFFKRILDTKINGRRIVILRDPSSADINEYIMPNKSGNTYQIAISIDGHIYVTNADEPVYDRLALLKASDDQVFRYIHSNYDLISFKVEPNRRIMISPKNEQPPGSIVDLSRVQSALKNAYFALDASGLVDDGTLIIGPNLRQNLTLNDVVSEISWDHVDWIGNGKKVDRTIMDQPITTRDYDSRMNDESEDDEDEDY